MRDTVGAEPLVDLPTPDAIESSGLLTGPQAILYKFLFERRADPPTMVQIRSHMQEVVGRALAQTDRRVRDLRKHFDVPAVQTGRVWVYPLRARAADASPPAKRSAISKRTEAAVFERDGYFCAMCGRSPRDQDGVKLVIDHKIPVKWGGTNDASNLQVLCIEHNHGKQAHFASFDVHGDAIRWAIGLPEVHLRIGELLKALKGQPVAVELISTVAREENRGDPTKRLRELRQLGWEIENSVRRVHGSRSQSTYTLVKFIDWPPEGPAAAIGRMERQRKALKHRGAASSDETDTGT